MTRFARAKGSKSSNERAPEDSTPWEVMKEQLLQAKKESEHAKNREEAEKQRIENYENFLREHKTQKRKATWCDFPETKNENTPKVPKQQEPSSKIKNTKQKAQTETAQVKPVNNVTDNDSKKRSKKKKKQNKQEVSVNEPDSQKNEIEQTQSTNIESTQDNVTEKSSKKKKSKKKKQKNALKEVSQSDQFEINDENSQALSPDQNIKSKNKKKKNLIPENNESRQENDESVVHNIKINNSNHKNNNQNKKQKNKKLVDGVPARRKPIDDRSFQLIINGKEVELVRFDGFPIMKRDAERLDELKKNMIQKGIPKSEVNRTLKLERRRAEKALARLKRDVCYNCRKGGHNLSDCPELKTKIPGVGAPDGVCFKCGSTEHRQFECKVQKDKEFRFATCFICKEPGHIARQCPDNPKGLYPNGGGCKLCGDVTHLRKDCPTTMSTREETSIKLQTLDSTSQLEGIEQKIITTPQETVKKPKKIKF